MTDHMQSTPPVSTTWPVSLIAVLEEQDALARELSDLAAGQAALIDTGKTEALLGLLATRQRLVDRFVAGQGALGQLSAELEARSDDLSADQRDRIRSLLDNVTAGLATVMRQDEQDQKLLQTARASQQKQIEGVDVGRSARNAYINTQAASRFTDHKG